MNQTRFEDWLLTYFTLGLGCSRSVLEALFIPERRDGLTFHSLLYDFFVCEIESLFVPGGALSSWQEGAPNHTQIRSWLAIGEGARMIQLGRLVPATFQTIMDPPYETCSQFVMTLSGDQLHYVAPYLRFGYVGGDVPFWGAHLMIRDVIQYMVAEIKGEECYIDPCYK
jgi:hypothetical protein